MLLIDDIKPILFFRIKLNSKIDGVNYITHDAGQKIPPISEKKNSSSFAYSHEAPQMM